MTFDEHDLRTGLRALTAAPPPPPPERAARSARRWRTIQVRRASVAAVTAFAVAVPVVALTRDTTPAPVVSNAAAALRSWPDRRNPAYRPAADAALAYVTGSHRIPDTSLPVRWLYADQVPGTNGTFAAAWAYCDAAACRHVVLAYQRLAGMPDWTVVDGDVPDDATLSPFGWYFRGVGPGSVLFALGPSQARTLTYAVPGRSGEVRGRDGVFTANIGYVSDPPEIEILGDGRTPLFAGRLRIAGHEAVAAAR